MQTSTLAAHNASKRYNAFELSECRRAPVEMSAPPHPLVAAIVPAAVVPAAIVPAAVVPAAVVPAAVVLAAIVTAHPPEDQSTTDYHDALNHNVPSLVARMLGEEMDEAPRTPDQVDQTHRHPACRLPVTEWGPVDQRRCAWARQVQLALLRQSH